MKKLPAYLTLHAFFCLVLFQVCAPPAVADEIKWSVRSNHPNIVQLEFFSQDRDAAWPGGDRAYELKDSQFHDYSLSCQTGEKICFGAWVSGDSSHYWGAGADNDQACDSCCAKCGGSPPAPQELNE